MGRRIPRDLRPFLEEFERRELLSAITDLIAANSIAAGRKAQSAATTAISSQSIAVPQNQGVQGTNLAITPTGTLTKREQKKERFVAQYVGTYTVGAGRTSTEEAQTFITGVGSANTMLHSDIQLLVITPNSQNASVGIGGVATIFDRNLNSNSALGFNLSAPVQNVDRRGRPDYFTTVSLDPNISSGAYVEGFSHGIMSIHYIQSGKHTKGVISQGQAIVTIHAQVYSANTSFILRNANIDP
jgi:hypothetical protein